MRTLLKSSIAIVSAVALAGPSLAQTGGRPLSTMLTGDAEIPGPGDEDGFGTFDATVNPGRGEVCYTLTVADVEPTFAAHIHIGDVSSSGPPVVTLSAPTSGMSSGCAAVDRELAKALIQTPEEYYVNVHNADFPDGALRGQLGK